MRYLPVHPQTKPNPEDPSSWTLAKVGFELENAPGKPTPVIPYGQLFTLDVNSVSLHFSYCVCTQYLPKPGAKMLSRLCSFQF